MSLNKFQYAIVIPHYNSTKLLGRMLLSIPERDDLQIVVVDDCSSEEEVSNLKDLHHQNLQIIYMKENHGAGYARNEGLRHIDANWVTFVDSDDMFAEDAFSVFDQYANTDNDMLCYYVKAINGISHQSLKNVLHSEVSVRGYYANQTKKYEDLFRFRNNVCWNKLVRIDFLKKYHIEFEECQVNNDVLYTLCIGLHIKKYQIIPKELYVWIENGDSMTRKPRTIEREFLFYLQAQKRNGFFKHLGLKKYPFYRSDLLYVLYLLKKRGFTDTIRFFEYCKSNKSIVDKAKKEYLKVFE